MSFKDFSTAQDHSKKPQAEDKSKVASTAEQASKTSEAKGSNQAVPAPKS